MSDAGVDQVVRLVGAERRKQDKDQQTSTGPVVVCSR